jgi:hypothetical protein
MGCKNVKLFLREPLAVLNPQKGIWLAGYALDD